jgi:hypothetical protein
MVIAPVIAPTVIVTTIPIMTTLSTVARPIPAMAIPLGLTVFPAISAPVIAPVIAPVSTTTVVLGLSFVRVGQVPADGETLPVVVFRFVLGHAMGLTVARLIDLPGDEVEVDCTRPVGAVAEGLIDLLEVDSDFDRAS